MNILFGRLIGRQLVQLLTGLNCVLAAAVAWYYLFLVMSENVAFYVDIGAWVDLDVFLIVWSFNFDAVSVTMTTMVLTVSCIVHVYSFYYMQADPHLVRFVSYVSLFTWFMLILVNASNLVQFFIGWEGVGLCSYLLINFWFTRLAANKAAIKAMLINKIGDIFLLLAIVLILKVFKTADFDLLRSLTADSARLKIVGSIDLFLIICIFLLIGVVGKSAQFGLHTWLPSAMEGPTPVSALIHAATMVTAGIYLFLRTSFFFEFCTFSILTVVFIIGFVTALLNADVAINQTDVKKIVAYSTCSQLGIMLMACGLSNYLYAFFHLINHGFFKALIFLLVGVVIHSCHEEQDIRALSGLTVILPMLSCLFFIGSLSLSGFFFWGSFYSKEVIGDGAILLTNLSFGEVWFWANSLVLTNSARYCCELEEIFDDEPEGLRLNYLNSGSIPRITFLALFVLGILSLSCGFFFLSLVTNYSTDFFTAFVYQITDYLSTRDFGDSIIKVLLLTGIDFEYKEFVNDDDVVDELFDSVLTFSITRLKFFFYFSIDKGIIEHYGPHLIHSAYKKFVDKVSSYQFASFQSFFLITLYSFFIALVF